MEAAPAMLDPARQALLDETRRLIGELTSRIESLDVPETTRKALADSRDQLAQPFLLVVVGEFNAGNSAFINALVGARVLEEGVTPTTARVGMLQHGALAIVDTPGTNAVLRDRQAEGWAGLELLDVCKASRIWVFDRGVASEKNLEALRQSGGSYLVGTPRTLLRKVEAALLDSNWKTVREGIEVKIVPAPDGSQDTFILCRSADRRLKEAAIHERFERRIEDGLGRLGKAVESRRLQSRDALQQRLGRLKLQYSRVARAHLFKVEGDAKALSFSWTKDQAKADYQRHSEGAYLLRTNLSGHAEAELWTMYMQLNDAEAAFRTLKQDLSIRPIHHQREQRVNAHVLVCFLAYALYRTLDRIAKAKGLGITARKVLASLATIKTGEIILPLVDGREIRLRRVSRPDRPQAELLARLGLDLPERVGTDSLTPPM